MNIKNKGIVDYKIEMTVKVEIQMTSHDNDLYNNFLIKLQNRVARTLKP